MLCKVAMILWTTGSGSVKEINVHRPILASMR
jgi:hypothetical protein